jgi:hypothetical protein
MELLYIPSLEAIGAFVLGVITKYIFDYVLDKRKITYQKFEEHRFEALKDFFKAFSACQRMWLSLDNKTIMDIKAISEKELDSIIWVQLQELAAANTLVCLFFPKEIAQHFEIIVSRNQKLSSTLMDLRYKYLKEPDNYYKEKIMPFTSELYKKNDDDKLSLDQITNYIQNSLKSKYWLLP